MAVTYVELATLRSMWRNGISAGGLDSVMFGDCPDAGCVRKAMADMAAMARQAGLRSMFDEFVEFETLFLILGDE